VTDAIDSQMWREWDNFLRLLSELELTHLWRSLAMILSDLAKSYVCHFTALSLCANRRPCEFQVFQCGLFFIHSYCFMELNSKWDSINLLLLFRPFTNRLSVQWKQFHGMILQFFDQFIQISVRLPVISKGWFFNRGSDRCGRY
jgi:hypothetical protein